MLPNKKKRNDDFSESCSTECDAEPLITDSEASNSLRHELKEAINTMGPHSEKSSEFEEYQRNLIDIDAKTYTVDTPEIEELYKKESNPIDESNSEIEGDKILLPKCYDIPPMPRDKFYQCKCHKENYIPIIHKNNRTSRLENHTITKWFKEHTTCLKKDKNKEQSIEFYKMHVLEAEDDYSPPRKVVFNLVDSLPKPECTTRGVNTSKKDNSKDLKERKNQFKRLNNDDESVKNFKTMNKRNETMHYKIKNCKCGIPTRVDVYYFDHGNASYLRTTDNPPLIKSEIIADQSEEYTAKFWGEVFGTIHIGVAFVTSFILQLLKFVLQSILRPLSVGVLQISSDYLFKPCLATLFNAILQPPLIFLYNICTSLRDICDPIAEGIGYFIREIALLFKSCRLVDVKTSKTCEKPTCDNQVIV